MDSLSASLAPIEPVFLNPGIRGKKDDVADGLSTFGHDLFQVYCSDVVLVDARDRRGIGIGIEMALAKNYNLPILALTERNTYYHKDRLEYLGQVVEPFIHPFIESLSDSVVFTTDEAASWIKDFLDKKITKPIINKNIFTDGMKHYLYNNLKNDPFMHDIVKNNSDKMRLVEQLPAIEKEFINNI
ncbi:MAG: hypothetical protein D3903_21775 [Candidatus Electrothrix sp. GM3_4]|nr:hypothetical protein [Candidatus Electrothrix sp. GM3_4]